MNKQQICANAPQSGDKESQSCDKESQSCDKVQQFCWINQKGAGTGKTWSCVGLVKNGVPTTTGEGNTRFTPDEGVQFTPDEGVQFTPDEGVQFTTFIYLSKMNTAKAVIKEEFVSQFGKHRCYFEGDVATIELSTSDEESQPEVKVIVSTIDSMIYAFANRDVMSYTRRDYYSELVYCFDINRPKFEEDEAVWNNITFDNQTLVVIDECQDLEEGYIEKFMRNLSTKGVSFYLMGDILQSVVEQNNIFEYLRVGKHLVPSTASPQDCGVYGFHNTKFIRLDSSKDKIIRFHSTKFIELVNDVVDFEHFGANPITSCCDGTSPGCRFKHNNEPQFLVETGDSTTEFMAYLDKLVDDNDYRPQDILVITPIVDNAFMYRLETEINEYWADKINNGQCHQGQFCLLQTSKYGKIDLSVSQGKTRILSIHAAKGMGGTCVVLVNLLDKALLSHQTKSGDLKYESIVHVALTRQKENFLVYYGGYGAEGVREDDLAKTILGLENRLVTAPPKRRCVIPMETLASALKGRLDLINTFETRNSLRYRLGRLTSTGPGGYLEPTDLKVSMMVNTMMEVLIPMYTSLPDLNGGSWPEFKFMKPCFKRIDALLNVTVSLSLDPLPFKMGMTELELQDDHLGGALLEIIENIRCKMDTLALNGSDSTTVATTVATTIPSPTTNGYGSTTFCPLESYVVLYLLHKVSPFVTQNVGNIYHRMAKSINQGHRAEYHNDKICGCLNILDKTVVAERKVEGNPLDMEDDSQDDDPFGDFGIGDDDPFGDSTTPGDGDESEDILPTNPLDSLYTLLPENGAIPQSLGMATLAQIEDNFGYSPNFTIDLGMSDFFFNPVDNGGLVIALTIPHVTYINFMTEVTIPIMLYSYFIFKINDHLQTKQFPISHMFKPFVGMKPFAQKLEVITFHINRLDNNDKRVIEIIRDDEIFSTMDFILSQSLKTAFSSFVMSWVDYYRTVKKEFKSLSPSEIDHIKTRFGLQNVPDSNLLVQLKDVPSDIVGQVLDVIGKKNFDSILSSVINRVINDFVTVKV